MTDGTEVAETGPEVPPSAIVPPTGAQGPGSRAGAPFFLGLFSMEIPAFGQNTRVSWVAMARRGGDRVPGVAGIAGLAQG